MLEPVFDRGALAELSAIESDPAFERAPVMRRLLRFLVAETLAGRGDQLKSLTVAIEGLGRSDDFDPQIDSYPRVQVGRLRRMLAAYYGSNGSSTGVRLHIPNGSYRVDVVPDLNAEPTSAGASLETDSRSWTALISYRDIAIGLTLLAVAIVSIWLFAASQMNAHAWAEQNFPVVEIGEFVALDGTADQKIAAQDLRAQMGEKLSRFDSLEIVETPGGSAGYRVEGALRKTLAGTDVRIKLIGLPDDRLVWSGSRVVVPTGDHDFSAEDVANATSGVLAQPTGALHSDARRIQYSPDTPYGCWLEFMDLWNRHASADPMAVKACVLDWVRSDPSSYHAHALAAWIYIEGIRANERAGRKFDREKLLSMAEAEASRAAELKPTSAIAHYTLMHAALYRGDNHKVRNEAESLMRLNGNNPELVALAGMHLIAIGDISGEALLKRGLSEHYRPPSWANIGLFFAALLQDDGTAALAAAKEWQSPPPIAAQRALLAIAEARVGRVEQAKLHWKQAVALDPKLADDQTALVTWPIAPQMRRTMLAWLQPALE